MTKIDLITGFLGAGKTTFIKKYAKYLIDKGYNLCILENDFGAVNVDMMLLQELMSDNCELEMVSGGCDKDCHRRRFKTKLISMGMSGYDHVLVEPSGIFDIDEFFDIVCEEPLDKWYEIGSVIAIADANLEKKLSTESEYVLASEAAGAGIIVLSHMDEATEKRADETKTLINSALKKIGCKRNISDDEFLCKDINKLDTADFERISQAGYKTYSYVKQDFVDDHSFDSVYFMDRHMSEDTLKTAIKNIFEDKLCGDIFRIKGFMQLKDQSFIEINATTENIKINPIADGQNVIIVIGQNLNKDRIEKMIGG